jgi:polyhydroxybutyrate depolymerase
MKRRIQCISSLKKFQKLILFACAFLILVYAQNTLYAQAQEGSFQFDGQTRDYIVFLPQKFQPDMPVVFNLHGYRCNANWQMEYTLMNDVADTAGFLVVYPNAVYPGFNSGSTNTEIPYPDVDDVGFISALIDTIKALYNVDMSHIYCCGYSNGAHMTYKLVCQLDYRFAAVASVAGVMLDSVSINCNAIDSIPVLIFHGTLDESVPYDGGREGLYSVEETLNFWVERNNCTLQTDTISLPDEDRADSCTVERISYVNCPDENAVIFYKIIDGGHSWPSGTFSGPWSGNTNKDINASVEIWNFFKKHKNVTSIETQVTSKPNNFYLNQNYPNPFNPVTMINYQLPMTNEVDLSIYNLLGQKVVTLVSEKQKAGYHQVEWNASGFASGIYYYSIKAGEFHDVKKMILLR